MATETRGNMPPQPFTVMGTASEQLLARLVNAMRQARADNDVYGGVAPSHARQLADVLNEAEDYLLDNEQFVSRLAARGDMS